MKKRYKAALYKLELLQENLENYPINYNYYYIDNITKIKIKKYKISLSKFIKEITQYNPVPNCNSQSHISINIDIAAVINKLFRSTDPNIDKHSCEDALNYLFSIYKIYP
jgi:hypothetical protein